MNLHEALGAEIRAAAEDRQLPLLTLARDADVARASLYRYLDGERSVPLDLLERIAGALHLRPSELLARAEQRTRTP